MGWCPGGEPRPRHGQGRWAAKGYGSWVTCSCSESRVRRAGEEVAPRGQLSAQSGSHVVKGFVQRPASGAESLSEDVDGYAVDEQRDGDAPLVRGERRVQGVDHSCCDVGPFGSLLGIEVLGRGKAGDVRGAG